MSSTTCLRVLANGAPFVLSCGKQRPSVPGEASVSRKKNVRKAVQATHKAKETGRLVALKGLKAWEAGAPEREAKNLERLRRDAILVLVADGELQAGIIPGSAGWEFVERSGLMPQKEPFEDAVEAVLWLYAEKHGMGPMRANLNRLLQETGNPEDDILEVPKFLEIEQRGEVGAALVNQTRTALLEAWAANEIEDDDLDLLYAYFADEPTRAVIEAHWAEENEPREGREHDAPDG